MRLAVHLQPRASRNAVVGWQGDELKIALTAPPVDGAANAALIDFLAATLQIKKRQIRLISGQTNRHKLLQIDETETAVLARLPAR